MNWKFSEFLFETQIRTLGTTISLFLSELNILILGWGREVSLSEDCNYILFSTCSKTKSVCPCSLTNLHYLEAFVIHIIFLSAPERMCLGFLNKIWFLLENFGFCSTHSQSALPYPVLVMDSWSRRTNTSHTSPCVREWGPGNVGVHCTYRPPAGSQCSHSGSGLLLPFF